MDYTVNSYSIRQSSFFPTEPKSFSYSFHILLPSGQRVYEKSMKKVYTGQSNPELLDFNEFLSISKSFKWLLKGVLNLVYVYGV